MRTTGLLLALSLGLFAQGPQVTNAKWETRPATGNLEAELGRIVGPAWAGYAAPAQRQNGQSCCWNSSHSGCGLEGRWTGGPPQTKAEPIRLEGSSQVMILFRVVGGKAQKVQAFSMGCPVDAGGLPFIWFPSMNPVDAIPYLERSADSVKDAMVALALQSGQASDEALVRLAKNQQSGKRRGQALFWLANKASAKAIPSIEEAIESDPDTDVKKQAVFALSQLPKEDGVPQLINVARNNKNMAVRKQAMFWLGQSNDPRALAFLEQILLN